MKMVLLAFSLIAWILWGFVQFAVGKNLPL